MSSNLSISLLIGASVGGALAGLNQVRSTIGLLRDNSLDTTARISALTTSAVGNLGKAMTTVSTVGLGLQQLVQPAIAFESAMADVLKVVDFKAPDGFKKLSDDLLELTRTIPLTAVELAQIAAAGGQLGVAEQDLKAFTTTIAKMSTAFDMSAETAGDSMAKLANVYKIPIKEIDKLGDAINALSNSSPAKASEIVDTLGRVGGLAQQFGLTQNQATALAGAFIALGKTPEVAGTAINGLMTKLATLDVTGKKPKKVFQALGLDIIQFKELVQKDGQQAILTLLEHIDKIPQEQRISILTDLFGAEYADDVAALSGGLDTYRQQLKTLHDVDEQGKPKYLGSMEKEFTARSATTENNLKLLKSSINEIAITLGNALLPIINDVVNSLKPLIQTCADWLKNNPALASSFIKVGLAGSALVASFLAINGIFALSASMVLRVGTHMSKVAVLMNMLRGQYGLLSGAMRLGLPVRNILTAVRVLRGLNILGRLGTVFNVLKNGALIAGRAMLFLGRALLMNPIGLAITAIAVGAYLIYRYWQPITGFFIGVWQSIKTAFAPVDEFFSGLSQGLMIELVPLKSVVMSVVHLLVSAWGGLKNIVGAIFEGIATVIGLIGSRIVAIVSGLVDLLGVAWQGLITVLQPVIDLFGHAFDGITIAFSGLWQSVQRFIQPIITAISDFFNITEVGFRSTGEMIGLVLGGAITGLVNIFSSSISAIVSLFSDGIRHLMSTILSFSPVSLFSQILSGLSPYISAIWESIKAIFSGGIGNLISTILSFSPVSLFAQVFAGVGAFFSGLVGNFSEYGRNLMQGLINGISSMIDVVTAKISGVASQVKSAFTTPTQIHSPSRIFIGYGQNLMQGLAIGIDKTSDLAIQGISQVGLGLLNQMPSQLPTPTFIPTEPMVKQGIGQSLMQKVMTKIPMLQPVFNMAKQAQALFLDEPTIQGFTRLERPIEQYSSHYSAQHSSVRHGAITVHFNPTIQVNVQNADVQQQVQQGLQMSMYEFEMMFNRLMEQQKRRAF